jgi:hypothetical protein
MAGRLLLGSTTDTTELLQVNGTAKVTGLTTLTTSAAGSLTAKIRNTVSSASANTGYGLAIESEASGATSYALTIRNLAETTTYLHVSTATGIVGNVGINTITPTQKLDVVGYARATSGFVGNAGISFWADNTSVSAEMRLSNIGNLAIGVTPSAWGTGTKGFDIGSGSAIWNPGSQFNTLILNNAFNNGTNYIYKGSGAAAAYGMQSGNQHIWYQAISGTANGNITFTQAMTLNSSGRLLLNQTGDTGEQFQVTGTAKITGATSLATGGGLVNIGNATPFGSYKMLVDGHIGLTPNSGSTRYIIIDDESDYTGTFALQAGRGSAGFGGGLVMYGHSHATKPGWVTAGISAASGGKFSVNHHGGGTGTDVFTVDINGNTVITNSLTVDGSTFFVDAANNRVGIGNLIPSSELHIQSGTPTLTITSTTTTGTTIGNKGNRLLLLSNSSTVNNGGEIVWGAEDTNTERWAAISGAIKGNNASGSIGDIVFATKSAVTDTTLTERVLITSDGNFAVDSATLFVDATNNEVGIGTNVPNSSLQVVGSVSKSVVAKTANYTATVSDHTILCDASSGGFTITLPAANTCSGRIYVIKKTNASSGVNSVTIDGNGAETIDGSATISLSCKSSAVIQCDGTNWHVLSLYTDTSCI